MKLKIGTFILTGILILLIGMQSYGGKYGSYGIYAWLWLLVAISPLVYHWLYQTQRTNKRKLIYLGLLILVILVQPAIKMHPIYVLAGSLIIILPFVIQTIFFPQTFGDAMGNTDEALDNKPNLQQSEIADLLIDKEAARKALSDSLDLPDSIKQKARKLITTNHVDECLDLLLEHSTKAEDTNQIIALHQKWNQYEQERNLELNSQENLRVMSSKIINTLLHILS